MLKNELTARVDINRETLGSSCFVVCESQSMAAEKYTSLVA